MTTLLSCFALTPNTIIGIHKAQMCRISTRKKCRVAEEKRRCGGGSAGAISASLSLCLTDGLIVVQNDFRNIDRPRPLSLSAPFLFPDERVNIPLHFHLVVISSSSVSQELFYFSVQENKTDQISVPFN